VVGESTITDGKIMVAGGRPKRGAQLCADCELDYCPGLPIAVVKAKRTSMNADDGVEQAGGSRSTK
jgi:type I restriction enzyme R subunit